MLGSPQEFVRATRHSAGRLVSNVTRISPRVNVDYAQCVGEVPPAADVKSTWSEFQESIIQEAFVAGNIRPDFLRTKMLRQTVGPSQYRMGQRLVERLRADEFGKKLLLMVADSPFGEPFLLPSYPLLSSVGAQNLYYLFLLKKLLNENVLEYDGDFVDFGGGYGYFSRAVTLLNDRSDVYVLDLPIMGVVQQAFHEATLSPQRASRIKYVDAPALQSGGANWAEFQPKLVKPFHFNATFSLSECDRATQLFVIENIVVRSSSFLIIYARNYHGVNNEEIYKEDIVRICSDHDIKNIEWKEYSYGNIAFGRKT